MPKKTVAVIALEATKNYVYAWVEVDDAYVSYVISPTQISVDFRYLKEEYTDYEHFVGVVGKFCPYTRFFVTPIQLPLRFDSLRDEATRRQSMNNQDRQEQ